MKKYQVTAIGNALVDYQIKVDDNFLVQNNIEKSLMTLVDEQRQKTIIELSHTNIIQKQGGGSASNSMFAFAQLGGKGYYHCRVSNDEDGRFFINDLKNIGLELNLDPNNLPNGITGKCLVMITPDSQRTMNTFLGISVEISEKDLVEEAISNSEYIYLEGALITSKSGKVAMSEARKIAKQKNIKTAFTFWDSSMVKYFKEDMKALVNNHVDLLFCNEDEAKIYTEKSSLNIVAEKLKKIADQFVITRGEKGSLIWDGSNFIEIDPCPVTAIDTTGAGDMYAGVFLYGLTNNLSIEQAGNLSSLASAKVVSQYGARISTESMKEIYRQVMS